MLYMPEAPPIYRILSIDPGSDTLGVALLDVDLVNNTVTVVHAETFNAKRAIRTLDFVVETFGERQARLNTHAQGIERLLYTAYPHCIISESPFLGRFPQAFESLVECLYMLRSVVAHYDPSMCLETIDPGNAKRCVGAPTKRPKTMSKDGFKETVRLGIRQLNHLRFAPHVNIDTLDEHAIDAIAVGCYKVSCFAPHLL